MLRPVLLVALLAASPVVAQTEGAPTAETVVATVNGQAITLGQMIAMKDGMSDDATSKLPAASLWDMMLDQMIRQTAVAQQKDGKLTARDTAALELDRRAYLAGAVLEAVAATDPTEDEMKAVYDKTFPATDPKTEYHAAHILVKTEDEAKSIVDALAKGADFGTLAEEKSTDPGSGPNKGDLGWFEPAQMVQPFADALRAMKVDEVSAPVESKFGWHVIKLFETREAVPPKFDEIKPQLAVQVRRDRVEAAIDQALKAAKVEKTEGLDPELLNKASLLGE